MKYLTTLKLLIIYSSRSLENIYLSQLDLMDGHKDILGTVHFYTYPAPPAEMN